MEHTEPMQDASRPETDAVTGDPDMTDLVGAVEKRLTEVKAKLAQGESLQQDDLEPLGDEVAQLFVKVSVIASWE